MTSDDKKFTPFPLNDVEQSISERFEKQVQLYPSRLAITDINGSINYADLNRLANRYGHSICEIMESKPNQVVLYLDKNIQYLAAIFGVLKAGHCYVPIDPEFPDSRNSYIVEDVKAELIITNSANYSAAEAIAGENTRLLNLDRIASDTPETNLNISVSPDALAYIIYTSGSTGKPKGVMQNHRNILHGCMRRTNLQYVTPEDRMTLFYSCSVMGSVYCIYGALLNGASLFPYDIRAQGLDGIESWLISKKITIYHSVASVFREFASNPQQSPEDFYIRLVIFGGERVLTSDVELARKVFSNKIEFYTGLGSTETGTIRYFYIGPETKLEGKVVPIGYPVEGMEVVLADDDNSPVAPGDIGEITVRSRYIALGYWNNPTATQKVFETLVDDPDIRVYHTGDMGQIDSTELLTHKGRKDFQVKIRGFRVEIGEVETALLDLSAIEEAVVVARDAGSETQLAAYLVFTPQAEILDVRNIRAHLQARLPYYMVPTIFVRIDSMPRTPNNKVDRNGLPAPSPDNELIDSIIEPADTKTEQTVIDICARLLRRDQIGVTQNFFDIGGHSLSATQLIARINEQLGIKLSMREIFETENFRQLAQRIDELRDSAMPSANEEAQHFAQLKTISRDKALPVSFAQKRMWLVDRLYTGSAAYNISNTVRLRGQLDIKALEQAINAIVDRHEVLRTVFAAHETGPRQVVLAVENDKLEVADLTSIPEEDRLSEALTLVQAIVSKHHDLARGPLFERKLLDLGNNDYILVLVFNHIIYDNIWSSGIFFKELSRLYQAFMRGESNPLPALPFQFADYADWEQSRLSSSDMQKNLAYWKTQLSNLPEPLLLPSARPRPVKPTFAGGQVGFKVPVSVSNALKHIARVNGATVFMVLLSGWHLLLHRYSARDDILVGTPSGRRYLTETENMIGLFINNLVIRADFSIKPSFKELLAMVRQTSIDAFSHDELPFETLVSEINPGRSSNVSPIFQHLFIHRNATQSEWKLPGLELSSVHVHPGGSKFDLTLSMLEQGDELSGTLEYSKDLFNQDAVERMAENYIQLLTSAIEQPDLAVDQLNMLAPAEHTMVLEKWNNTNATYPEELCTHQLFELKAQEYPDKVALICNERQLTYVELNQKANQLARELVAQGVGPDKLVAICMNRSPELIIALLAVMKSGGAYIPLDPDFPPERLSYMVEDAQAALFITQEELKERFGQIETQFILLESESEIFSSQTGENLTSDSSAQNLAYVIYTSGSTGKPKGVQINHRALVNFLVSMQQRPGLHENDVVQAVTTISFDIAGLEIYLPLITGATVLIGEQKISLNPPALLENMRKHGATIMQATPITWRLLLDFGWHGDPKIKVLCGGEAMGLDLAERLLGTGCEIWNMYGPTETTIWSSVRKIELKNDAMFVGEPIANTQFYVVNTETALQPIGVPGELLIGGDGLAQGYFNLEDITRERFIDSPYPITKRLYRTGDLVVRNNTGNLEFLGRIDNQVKIRGYRIELGDIETQLSELPEVKQAVAVTKDADNGDKLLVAYLVTQDNTVRDPLKYRQYLRDKLPEYMLPNNIVFLDEFPLTPNGKVDRKQLPAPSSSEQVEASIMQKDGITYKLIEIFQNSLNTKLSGTDESFFDLGGHSLLALNAMMTINKTFGCELPPTLLFDHPSVAKLSKIIHKIQSGKDQAESEVTSDEYAQQVDQIIQVVTSANGMKRMPGASTPQMRESWFCKYILAPIYPKMGRTVQEIMKWIILKLEGGTPFTVTLRKLFKQCYNIEIGDFTSQRFIADKLRNNTKVGKYSTINRSVMFQNADHPRNTLATHGMFYHPNFGFTPGYELERVQIEVGNDVWIGDGAKILYPTQKIGDGAIIAAGAIVIGDVPPYAVVGGYPAQVLRYRFSKPTIEKLLALKWWDMPIEDLQSVRDEFMKPLEGSKIR